MYLLKLCSALLTGLVPFVYYVQMHRGKTKPNPATFTIFLTLSLINAATYIAHVGYVGWESLFIWQNVMALAPILGLLAIAHLVFARGYRTTWRVWDTMSTVGIGAVAVLWFFFEPGPVNLLTQVVVVAGIVPTIIAIGDGRVRDHPLAWGMAFVGYVLMTIILYYADGKTGIYDLTFPATRVLMNGAVLTALFRVRKELSWAPF